MPQPTKTPKPKEKIPTDKGTLAAFGVLFVLPILIILGALLFLFPYILSQVAPPDNSGAITSAGPNQLPPRR